MREQDLELRLNTTVSVSVLYSYRGLFTRVKEIETKAVTVMAKPRISNRNATFESTCSL